MEGAFKMSGLRRWCLIASISLRHVCHRHGSEPIPENQCPLEPLRRLDRVAGKPSKCYSVLTAQNPQCKVRNTSPIERYASPGVASPRYLLVERCPPPGL